MKSYLYHNRPYDIRRGFTVVEVLVAITIIAILAAILTPVVGSALRRANEFAIESEMSQLDLAIEHFKSDNGFYPPSFASFDSADDILPYLNRLAPNHAEGNGGVGTRLKNWWDQVGSDLAKKDAIFLHCLPRGNEVTEEVFLGKQSKVWQQALNRVYVQKSILLYCFDKLR